MSDPVAGESMDDGPRVAVRDGNGFGTAGKTVETGKEESLSVGGREGSDQVKVDLAKADIG